MRRECGGCTLCCRLLPMPEIIKPAGERCPFQHTGKGCAIYQNRPTGCRLWHCMWLANDVDVDIRRPDRSHYVIDPSPDFITLAPNDGGEPLRVAVVQIWIDPKFPEAHRDPALRAWLERNRKVALIRYNALDGMVLAPPSRSDDREWHEQTAKADKEHTAEERLAYGGPVSIEVRQ